MTLHVKRDDLIHPTVQGNKWRKLHRTLARLQREGVPGVVSFGGAFSNSLHALAHAGPLFQLQTAAILRGVAADFSNPTLAEALRQGMRLFPVPKTEYDQKMDSPVVQAIVAQFPGFAIVPEGGATAEGLEGCADIAREIRAEFPDVPSERLFVAVPAGTGCTAAGILAGLEGFGTVLVFPAAAYGVNPGSIAQMLTEAGYPPRENFHFFTEFIRGKFARPHADILAFAHQFEQKKGIRLDPFYTSRMMYGIDQLEQSDFFPPDAVVVAVHTGGLQGWQGFSDRFLGGE